MTDERDWALACVLGARDRTDNEKVRQGLLDAYHMLVTNQPTDEPTEADPYPDGLPEDLYVDIESTIHQHCGHDGQSDEANDWVTDLMSAISPPIVRALVGGRSAAPREHVATHDAADPLPFGCICGERYRTTNELSGHFGRVAEGRPAAPTREQLREAIADARPSGQVHFWPLHYSVAPEWIDSATDRVAALLSRSAAEPPEDARTAIEQAYRAGELAGYQRSLPERVEGALDAPASPVPVPDTGWRRIKGGVAAEPKEHGDG